MAQALDIQLQHAMDKLNNKQKKAVLEIVKAFVEEEEYPVYDHWKDKKFVSELEQEYNDYKNGKIKGASIEEVERKARENARKQRLKKAS